MDINILKLENQINFTRKHLSSDYKKYLTDINYKNIYSQFSTGGFVRKTILKNIFNFFFSRLVYGFKIFKTENLKKLLIINNRINVGLNINNIRHLFILKILKENINPKTICVIGDGKANFVINAFINFANIKIYSINLPEVHINDYLIITKSKIIKKNQICVVTKKKQKIDDKKKLILITSNLKNFINNINIDLFVSIAAFQEMPLSERDAYLRIIFKKKKFFYFCEREKKILSGNEENYFKDYFPKKFKIIFKGQAKFYRYNYDTKFPFIHKQKKTMHSLIKIK